MTKVAIASFEAYLLIGGDSVSAETMRFEVGQVQVNYALNTIPTASCSLGLGRLASNPSLVSNAHSFAPNLSKFRRARLYFSAFGSWSTTQRWPEGPTVIFDGYVASIGYRKAAGQVQLVAQLTHWLSDLNFSSMLSQRSNPSNPAQYTFSALSQGALSADVAGAAGGGGHISGMTAAAEFINADTIAEDLWGGALKPFLCFIGQQDTIEANELLDCVEFPADGSIKNDVIIRALSRIEGETSTDFGFQDATSCNLARSEYTPPLELDPDADEFNPLIADAIAQQIGSESIQAWLGTTMWTKILMWAGEYRFVIVPQPEKALVVSPIPGGRTTYSRIIAAADYVHIDVSLPRVREIRAVGLFAGLRDEVGAISPNAGADQIGIGGCFTPADADENGQVLLTMGPSWLRNMPVMIGDIQDAVGVGGDVRPNNAVDPLDPAEKPAGRRNKKARGDIVNTTKDLFDRYAHLTYLLESLRGRTGNISGKLRFDIAPGSTVLIEGSTEQFLGATDALGQSLVGLVVGVSINLNAENGNASTSFKLDHIRTLAENNNDRTSVAEHPLYDQAFVGAPLIDRYAF